MSECVQLYAIHTQFRDGGLLEYEVTTIEYGLTESKAMEEWARFDRT
jgi:hypothetical protein